MVMNSTVAGYGRRGRRVALSDAADRSFVLHHGLPSLRCGGQADRLETLVPACRDYHSRVWAGEIDLADKIGEMRHAPAG
jgi:hypothetical protein